MEPATPKPEPFRQVGFKLHESQFDAIAAEAAKRTRASRTIVSVSQIVREAIAGHLARLGRSRSGAAA
jgi:hypothetical protein